jgi:hypothetical protein
MKAILIDPFAKEITEIEYDGNWQQIGKIIDCELFTTAGLSDGDTVFVDDEGLFKGETAFFKHAHYPQPLAGKGLILGTDSEGDSISPQLTLLEHKAQIAFVIPLKINGKILWLPAD